MHMEHCPGLSTTRERKGWDTDKVRMEGTKMSKHVLLGERRDIY